MPAGTGSFPQSPLGLVAFVLTRLWVRNVRSDEFHAFDWLTFLLAGLASTGTVYGMEKLGGEGAHWQVPVAILTASALTGVLAIAVAPPPRYFAHRS